MINEIILGLNSSNELRTVKFSNSASSEVISTSLEGTQCNVTALFKFIHDNTVLLLPASIAGVYNVNSHNIQVYFEFPCSKGDTFYETYPNRFLGLTKSSIFLAKYHLHHNTLRQEFIYKFTNPPLLAIPYLYKFIITLDAFGKLEVRDLETFAKTRHIVKLTVFQHTVVHEARVHKNVLYLTFPPQAKVVMNAHGSNRQLQLAALSKMTLVRVDLVRRRFKEFKLAALYSMELVQGKLLLYAKNNMVERDILIMDELSCSEEARILTPEGAAVCSIAVVQDRFLLISRTDAFVMYDLTKREFVRLSGVAQKQLTNCTHLVVSGSPWTSAEFQSKLMRVVAFNDVRLQFSTSQ